MLYIREGISFKLLKSTGLSANNKPKALIKKHMNELGKVLDIYLHKYDHILLIGDLNSEISERLIHDFCNVYNLESLLNTHLF